MDLSAVGLWTALSAPACAAFGVSAANREILQGSTRRVGWTSACIIVALAAAAVASASSLGEACRYLILATALSYLAAYDLRAMAVPAAPILVAIALGLGVSVVEGAVLKRIVAASVGWGAFAMLDMLHRHMRGRGGLGAGDALVAALIGAWLGPEALAWSVALGGALGLVWTMATRRTHAPLPFVPALAAGVAVILIWWGLGP